MGTIVESADTRHLTTVRITGAFRLAILGLFVPVLASAAVPLPSDNHTVPADLARAVADYDRAQIEGNRTELVRLLADDYRLVNSGAEVENKTQMIADYTAPGFHLKPYVVEDEIIRVWERGAVMAGAVTLEGTSEGAPFKARLRFADIWKKTRGRWQVAFTEVTRIPAKQTAP